MLDYTAKMARHHHEATQDDIQRLRDVGFHDADILHMVYWIASFNMANTISDCLGYEVHEHITSIFVDADKAAELENAIVERNALSQESVRPGWEQAVVRALEGHHLEWVNADPLTWADVTDNVLLIMYWDALLPNTLLGLPYLQRWHDDHSRSGLVVLAPHVPEFPAAKDRALVERTMAEMNLSIPVILDPSFRQMAGANNRYWPAIHLIDRNGYVRYRLYGPGGYQAIDAMIEALLAEDAKEPDRATTLTVPDRMSTNSWLHPDATPELYARYALGRKAEGLAGVLGHTKEFSMPDQTEQHANRLYVSGKWIPHEEGLTLAEDTGHLTLIYSAEQGGIVISPGETGGAVLHVRLDGSITNPQQESQSESVFGHHSVEHIGYYELVRHGAMEQHRLDITVHGQGATVYRFNFLPFCGSADE